LDNTKQYYGMADLEVKYYWELVADTLVLTSAAA
jgi:hypothetical protein